VRQRLGASLRLLLLQQSLQAGVLVARRPQTATPHEHTPSRKANQARTNDANVLAFSGDAALLPTATTNNRYSTTAARGFKGQPAYSLSDSTPASEYWLDMRSLFKATPISTRLIEMIHLRFHFVEDVRCEGLFVLEATLQLLTPLQATLEFER
jgi:hypothetical protein